MFDEAPLPTWCVKRSIKEVLGFVVSTTRSLGSSLVQGCLNDSRSPWTPFRLRQGRVDDSSIRVPVMIRSPEDVHFSGRRSLLR